MIKEIQALQQFWAGPQSLGEFGLNLLIGAILALILQWHFNRYASTLSNRQYFSKIFVPLVLTTILIISVVKSSLALSLGLVGALSIVRFRTPIKEPEELIYLFLSIGVGLGLGANQAAITIFASLAILALTALLFHFRVDRQSQNVFLNIELSTESSSIEEAHKIVEKHIEHGNLRRFDVDVEESSISYQISIQSFDHANALANELKQKYDDVRVSFVDQDNIPHI